MKSIRDYFSKWRFGKHHEEGTCSNCIGELVPSMDDQEYSELMDEIDLWIESNFQEKSK